jgi:hypothetical protein
MMNLSKTTLALAFALAACGGGGGPEGAYKLDKAEMKKAMEADMAKLPESEKVSAKFGLKLLDAMDISITLEPGGKLKSKETKLSLDASKPAKPEEKEGTWKQEGDSLVLDTGDGKPLKCAKAPNKLTCKDAAAKPGDMSLIFVKG